MRKLFRRLWLAANVTDDGKIRLGIEPPAGTGLLVVILSPSEFFGLAGELAADLDEWSRDTER